jgi:hypothetical protein
MAAKQISIFETETIAPYVPPFINHRLFSDCVFGQEMKKWREWKRAPKSPEQLRAALEDAKINGRTGMVLDVLGLRAIRETGGCLVLTTSSEPSNLMLLLSANPDDIAARCRLVSTLENVQRDWGVITDGSKWLLLRRGLFCSPERRLEADAGAIIASSDIDDLQTFFLLFGAVNFMNNETFADSVFRASRAKTLLFSNSLRSASRIALETICKGFIAQEQQTTGAVPADDALDMIYKHSLIIIQRLIFIFYAEAAGVLPSVTNEIGFGNTITSALSVLSEKKLSPDFRYTLWESLRILFHTIHQGSEDHKIPCLGGTLFDPESHPFLSQNSVPDLYLAEVLSQLSLKHSKTGKPCDGYKELDACDITDALSPLANLRGGLAAYPMVLADIDGSNHWIQKSQAKWKKTISQVKKGEYYLEEPVATVSYQPQRETVNEYVARSFSYDLHEKPRIFVPEISSGLLLLTIIDAASRFAMLNNVGTSADYSDALREAAQNIFALDSNDLNIEIASLGVWLLTINKLPPLYLGHNIRAGSALCGINREDIGALPSGSKTNSDELANWSREISIARSKNKPVLSSVRARESGFLKVEKKMNLALQTPELRSITGVITKTASEKQTIIIHPPLFFSEVFFNEGRPSGFDLIFVAPEPKQSLSADESDCIRKKLNMRGSLSAPDAAARRYTEFLAPCGTLALLAPARFLKTARSRSLTNNSLTLPGFSGISTKTDKLPSGFVLILIKLC